MMNAKVKALGLRLGSAAILTGFMMGNSALAQQGGTRTRTAPVNVTVTNTTFVVSGSTTGSGNINSPAGAILNSNVTGTGTFNYSAKYLGNGSLQANMSFTIKNGISVAGTTFLWLHTGNDVKNSQVRGTATINGAGSYSFLITGHDGGTPVGSNPDYFRIQVYHLVSGSPVYDYDNLRGQPDLFDISSFSTTRVIAGSGDIQIKK